MTRTGVVACRLIGWYVEGLLEEPVANAAEALRLFERGLSERRTAGTVHNAQSSRSHAIFTLTIKSRCVVERMTV